MNLFKKIISIILIFSLSLFSPVVFSAVPAAVAVGASVAGAVYGALSSPVGKKVIKKIASKLGFDDGEVDSDGNVVFTKSKCFSGNGVDGYFEGELNYVSYMGCTKLVDGTGVQKITPFINELNYWAKCSGIDKSIHVRCEQYKEKKVDLNYILREIREMASKGDKDAQDVLDEIEKRSKKKKDDDDTDDKDDGNGQCRYNPSLKSDDPLCKKKDDDDDDDDDDDTDDGTGQCRYNPSLKSDDPDCKKKKDDDDEDDVLKCDSTQFHKKVCDWIDWTYDETDKAKKKISEFFDDDEALSNEKKDLKDLVEEKEPEDKKSNFDLVDACPSPRTVTSSIMGRTISIEVFNFTGICKWAEFIEFGLNTTAMIIAFNIITGRRQD